MRTGPQLRLSLRSISIHSPYSSSKGNVFHYSAVISDSVRAGQWQLALHVFAEMDAQMIEKNRIVYNSAMTAFEHGGQWALTLQLLDEMAKLKVLKVPLRTSSKQPPDQVVGFTTLPHIHEPKTTGHYYIQFGNACLRQGPIQKLDQTLTCHV